MTSWCDQRDIFEMFFLPWKSRCHSFYIIGVTEGWGGAISPPPTVVEDQKKPGLNRVKLDLIIIYLGSLSNYDGNANENVTQKTNFTSLKLLRYYPMAELTRSWICKDGGQVQIEKGEFAVVCSRSP